MYMEIKRAGVRPRANGTIHTYTYTHYMPRGVALCCRDGIDRRLPLNAQLRPDKSVRRFGLRERHGANFARVSHVRCFVGTGQATRSPNLPQLCDQCSQARRRCTNQACGA